MKKIILTVAAIAAFGSAQAQVKFGAKVGANFANISESYDNVYGDDFNEDYKMIVGAHVGGFVEFKFGEKFALQPELLFSMQGAKVEGTSFDGDGFDYTYESKVHLNYINVPVMFKFYPIEKLFIEAGPQVGFLVSAKSKDDYKYTDGTTTVSESETVDVKDYFKSVDFGVNVGVGYEFTEMIFANVRYNIGLSDISDDPDDIDFGLVGDVFKTRNNVLSVSVGFKF